MKKFSMRRMSKKAVLLSIFMLIFLSSTLFPQSDDSKKEAGMTIQNWLQAGPVAMPLPLYHADHFKLKDLLAFEAQDVIAWWPAAGEKLAWQQGKQLIWQKATAGTDGLIIAAKKPSKSPQLTYLAAYLHADRWTKAELKIKSHHLLQLYVDGEKAASKATSEKEDAGELKHTLKLETGKHLLLLKVLTDPEIDKPFQIQATLEVDEKFGKDALSASVSPRQVMNIHRLFDGPKLGSVSISADGEWATVSYSEKRPPEGKHESWLELREVASGRLVQTFRGKTTLGGVRWAPIGKKFSYTESKSKETTLWLVDLEAGTQRAILDGVKDFGGYTWAPDGSFIIYSISETPEKDKRGVKRFQSPRDIMPWYRTKSWLYYLDVASGTRQRLTSGKLATDIAAISPDGKHLLFSQTVDDYANRPYIQSTLSMLNLADASVDTLGKYYWLGGVNWSPDGKKLLITGPASLFGDIGVNVPEGMIPNGYDTQAYLYDLGTQKATAITRDFDPAINRGEWFNRNTIYFSAIKGEYTRLFAYSVKDKSFREMNTNVEVMNGFDIAKTKPVAVYYGSSVSTPPQAYVLNLKTNKSRLLAAPSEADFRYMQFGDVKRWAFTNDRGVEIEGRVYYPPNFDPAKKYPGIVYYYGGTSVIDRSFGGRYPKNLFAAQGYVVYVLSPSGAPGFGQEFSAYHVNDWGNVAASEIMTGTKKFLESHPFVDKERIGCIGASYGGFMTMSLLTQTDMFATGISHAGISALSSYWGEGYWGYLYSAMASANSFPWNRKDIYVDQSPLFNADKVSGSLLLLHGDVDTNVPPGESDQFYRALKLLGKKVEYIQVEGQDHHILDYKKRIIWQKTIFAWFDKELKGQAEWWNELYSDE